MRVQEALRSEAQELRLDSRAAGVSSPPCPRTRVVRVWGVLTGGGGGTGGSWDQCLALMEGPHTLGNLPMQTQALLVKG